MSTKESIYKTHTPSNDGAYLKLKDGESAKVRFFSEPVITVYKKGDKPRYANLVWNHDKKMPQVFAYGVSVYGQIAILTEDWGEPTEFDMRISREGSTMQDTVWTVSPVKNSTALTKDDEKACEAVDVVALTKGKWLADYAEDGILPEPVVDELKREDVVTDVDDADTEDLLNSAPF